MFVRIIVIPFRSCANIELPGQIPFPMVLPKPLNYFRILFNAVASFYGRYAARYKKGYESQREKNMKF